MCVFCLVFMHCADSQQVQGTWVPKEHLKQQICRKYAILRERLKLPLSCQPNPQVPAMASPERKRGRHGQTAEFFEENAPVETLCRA